MRFILFNISTTALKCYNFKAKQYFTQHVISIVAERHFFQIMESSCCSCCSFKVLPRCRLLQAERTTAEGTLGELRFACSHWSAGGEVSVPLPAAGTGLQQRGTTQEHAAQAGGKRLPRRGNQVPPAGWGGTGAVLVCLEWLLTKKKTSSGGSTRTSVKHWLAYNLPQWVNIDTRVWYSGKYRLRF